MTVSYKWISYFWRYLSRCTWPSIRDDVEKTFSTKEDLSLITCHWITCEPCSPLSSAWTATFETTESPNCFRSRLVDSAQLAGFCALFPNPPTMGVLSFEPLNQNYCSSLRLYSLRPRLARLALSSVIGGGIETCHSLNDSLQKTETVNCWIRIWL